jgi:trehalose 6-phosphate phosphatase
VTALEPLAPIVADPAASAFLTDYDGTLAPIVDDPARARPLPAAIEALRALVPCLAVVAVVSGRPASFLRDQVPVAGVERIGVYGLERVVGDEVVTDERARRYADAVVAAAQEVEARWPGLPVERKGTLSFTVHWRTRPVAAPPAGALEPLADAHGLLYVPGRMAAELRVPVPVDKGTVVATLLDEHRVRAAAFAGDDTGDRAAFAALARRAAEEPGFDGLRIAVRSPEAPAALLRDADVVVDGPPGLAALLGDLARAIRPPG